MLHPSHEAYAQIDVEYDIPIESAADRRTTAEENAGYLSDENLLIVEVAVERTGTGENIEIFQHEGGFFVPLGYLSRVLEFPIKVEATSGQAEGWFIRENRIFALNLARGEVVVEGKKMSFDPAMAHAFYGDIYIEKSLFETWFPIDLELNFSDLVLKLKPREKIPLQSRLEREQARERIAYLTREEPLFARTENPYRAFSMPFINANLGYEYANNIDQVGGHNTPYSLRMTNDLAYTNMEFFLSGGARDGIQGLRTTFSRKDYDGELLAPLNLTEIEFGDVNNLAIPMVSTSSRGLGAVISNHSLARGNKFDSRDFIGDAIPGWDVELYRNGVLLDSIVVPSDGRYEFLDVPILVGNNSFRLVFYGPQGEIKEETETYLIDDSFAKKGQFLYELGVDQKSQTLFGVEERDNNIQHEETIRTAFSAAYGLTEQTTATAGFVSTPLNDEEQHHYLQAGLRQSFGNVFTNVNTAYDTKDKGSILQLVATTNISGVNVTGEQQFLEDFVSEIFSPSSQQRKRFSSLAFNGNVGTGQVVNYNLTGDYEVFEGDNNNRSSIRNRLATNMGGLLLSNQLNWNYTRTGNNNTKLFNGSFSVRGRWMQTLIRPTLNYEVSPDTALESMNLSAQRNLSSTLNMRADITKDLQGEKQTTFSTSLTKDFDDYRLSTNVQANDSGDMLVGMNLSFSLGREPHSGDLHLDKRDMTSYGAVSAQAFLDKNYNQLFDEEDEILPEVDFRGGGRVYKADKGEMAVFMPFITADRPVNLNVEQSSVPDPFWIADPEGYSIIARPGVTTELYFPVIITTEIDGEVYLQTSSGTRTVSGVTIELIDKKTQKIMQTQKSEFDGFYLFQKVPEGEYILRIAHEDLQYYGAIEDRRIDLLIPRGSDIVSNQNMLIVQSHEILEEESDGIDIEESAAEEVFEEQGAILPNPISEPSP